MWVAPSSRVGFKKRKTRTVAVRQCLKGWGAWVERVGKREWIGGGLGLSRIEMHYMKSSNYQNTVWFLQKEQNCAEHLTSSLSASWLLTRDQLPQAPPPAARTAHAFSMMMDQTLTYTVSQSKPSQVAFIGDFVMAMREVTSSAGNLLP